MPKPGITLFKRYRTTVGQRGQRHGCELQLVLGRELGTMPVKCHIWFVPCQELNRDIDPSELVTSTTWLAMLGLVHGNDRCLEVNTQRIKFEKYLAELLGLFPVDVANNDTLGADCRDSIGIPLVRRFVLKNKDIANLNMRLVILVETLEKGSDNA